MKIKLVMDKDRAILLMRACEVIARAGMGQFKDLAELLNPNLSRDEKAEIEKYLKVKIFPALSDCLSCGGTGYKYDGHDGKEKCSHCSGTGVTKSSGRYHAMHSSKCPEECKVAWDGYQHIRREISWQGLGKDWRKDPRDFSVGGMMGVNFDEPFKTSKLEGDFNTERIDLPVKVFKKSKKHVFK